MLSYCIHTEATSQLWKKKTKTKQPSNFRAYKGYPSLFKKLTLNIKDQAQALSKNQNQGQITKLLDSYRRQL